MPTRSRRTPRARPVRVVGRTGGGAGKPVPTVRLRVHGVTVGLKDCVVEVSNAGNLPSYGARVVVYRQPAVPLPNAGTSMPLAGSVGATVGALERVHVRVPTPSANPFASGALALVFDPLTDPFPVSRVGELDWLGRDLLRHDLREWDQWAHPAGAAEFGENRLSAVPRVTWALGAPAGSLPPNPGVRRVYRPGTGSGARSELRQTIRLADLDGGAFALHEARAGNLSARVTAELITTGPGPSDGGAVAVALDRTTATGSAPVARDPERPVGRSSAAWTTVSAVAGGTGGFDRVDVRLLAERRNGPVADVHLGAVRCHVIHRQALRVIGAPPIRIPGS